MPPTTSTTTAGRARRRWRPIQAGTVVLALLAALLTIQAGTASAGTGIIRGTQDAVGGVYWRSAPDWNAAVRIAGNGFYPDSRLELNCYQSNGGTVPPYWNNSLWYQARITGGTGSGSGWINDHFLNTGINQPNIPVTGVPRCGTVTVASAPKPPTVINGINVGYADPSKPWHLWGNCSVRDFNGGPHGHVIVSRTAGTHVVRNGMLWGWFDNGGAPSSLGCPTTDEYGYMNGVRQDFQRGSLVWASGMNHAVKIDPVREKAVLWAWNCRPNGACSYYDGQIRVSNYYIFCLGFVYQAYRNAGKDITAGLPDYKSHHSATTFWSVAKEHRPPSAAPPRGALIFWTDSQFVGTLGHVAISLGNGSAISTAFDGNPYIHVLHLTAAHQRGMAGWIMP